MPLSLALALVFSTSLDFSGDKQTPPAPRSLPVPARRGPDAPRLLLRPAPVHSLVSVSVKREQGADGPPPGTPLADGARPVTCGWGRAAGTEGWGTYVNVLMKAP